MTVNHTKVISQPDEELREAPQFAGITIWAWVGAAFVVLNLWLLGSWLLGGHFHPVPTGVDPVPLWMTIVAHSIEVITLVVFAVTAYVFAYRPWRRDGYISTDGMFVIALVTIYWQNTLSNYTTQVTFLSSAFTNFGSWYSYVPGWVSPNMDRMPEAPLAWGLCFACWFVFFPMKAGAAATHWIRKRRPQASAVRIFAVVWLAFMLLDFVLEGFFLRTGMYAYPGAIRSWTLWAGKTYQFPLYEVISWGLAWAVFATLYAYRDDRGLTLVERGVERLTVSPARKRLARFLAIAAAVNLIFLAQNALLIVISPHADSFPTGYKSYLTNGICGPGTAFDCGGPLVPISKKTTPTNRIVSTTSGTTG